MEEGGWKGWEYFIREIDRVSFKKKKEKEGKSRTIDIPCKNNK